MNVPMYVAVLSPPNEIHYVADIKSPYMSNNCLCVVILYKYVH
jgi:hypothetical protein